MSRGAVIILLVYSCPDNYAARIPLHNMYTCNLVFLLLGEGKQASSLLRALVPARPPIIRVHCGMWGEGRLWNG